MKKQKKRNCVRLGTGLALILLLVGGGLWLQSDREETDVVAKPADTSPLSAEDPTPVLSPSRSPVLSPALSPARSSAQAPTLSPARAPALSPAASSGTYSATTHALAATTKTATILPVADDRGQPDPVELMVMPPFDLEAALEDAKRVEEERGVYRFAGKEPVKVSPGTNGTWEKLANGLMKWTMEIQSPGAQNLNFHFSEFNLPAGAKLAMMPVNNVNDRREFSARDNDEHGQLWTPIIEGDHTRFELVLPEYLRAAVRLQLASVQHGFRSMRSSNFDKIGGDISGACNIDVICDGDDIGYGHFIDNYRDQIRSVGAYTLEGQDTCSGTLINNTANDRTPYFLTAEHCGITFANASSMVVYWNFESDECRLPDSVASGSVANGHEGTFNTGASFRMSFPFSDVCLVELDDPVNPAAVAYFSGWDRSGDTPTMVTGIHHPAVAEKRICFEFNPITITSYGDTIIPGARTHWRVQDWDLGTTEGGSSGSALFDQNGRVIGQLHGGFAACGNDESDWYGRLWRSWTGGGSDLTSLAPWLDPLDTGAMTMDGLTEPMASLHIEPTAVIEGDSGTNQMVFAVSVTPVMPIEIRFDVYTTTNGTATPGVDFEPLALTNVLLGVSNASVNVLIDVYGDLELEEMETIELMIANPSNAVLAVPATGEGIIVNDDFLLPIITSPLVVTGNVGNALIYQIEATNFVAGFAITNAPSTNMTVDAMTGVLDWVPDTNGTFTVDLVASNRMGSVTNQLTINIGDHQLREAIDFLDNVVTSPGSSSWFRQTEETFDGIDAAQSGGIGHGETNSLEMTIVGPDVVSFWWRTSSENNRDWLSFVVDGTRIRRISGNTDWMQVQYVVPAGSHILSWQYSKNGGNSVGDDAGYVDLFQNNSNLLGDGLDYDTSLVDTAYPVEWFLQSDVTQDGIDAVQSARIGNSETTSMSVDVTGPMAVSFWWKVSSEGPHDPEDNSNRWETPLNDVGDILRFRVDGVEERRISGEVDWKHVQHWIPAGTHTLTWDYEKDEDPNPNARDENDSEGDDAGYVDLFRLDSNVLGDAIEYEVDFLPSPLPNDWCIQYDDTRDGVDAAQSGVSDTNQLSSMSIDVVGPNAVAFWWRVSSRKGADFLRFKIDGFPVKTLSGEEPWQPVLEVVPPGTHTLTWEYETSTNAPAGLNAGFVDLLEIGTVAPFAVITSPLYVEGDEGIALSYTIETLEPVDSILVSGLPLGWEYDELTRTISVVAPVAGSFTMGINLTDENGTRIYYLDAFIRGSIALPTVELNEAVDVNPLLPLFGDQFGRDWVLQPFVTHDGVDAAASPDITQNFQRYSFSTTVVGPGSVSFWWKVSSEEFYDFLSFYHDDVLVRSMSGEVDWNLVTRDLAPGIHTLRWTYSKDVSLDGGVDRGYVDELTFGGYAGWTITNNLFGARALFSQDPELDGLSNLLEYALGSNPDGTGMLQGVPEPVLTGDEFVFDFPKVNDPGLFYEMESATSPDGPWTTDHVDVLMETPTLLRARANDSLGGIGFLRLRVDWIGTP